ncbi:MAG: hypothetical protein ACI9YT_000720 [Halobacteriales archaeon]|jgi:uncharacterized protein YjgD (DUF1641 family)
MSEPESSSEDALAEAIEENPEAVAEFVRKLDVVNELLDNLQFASAMMDDEAVEGLTGMALDVSENSDKLVESAEGLSTDETVNLATTVGENGTELSEAVETLVELQQSGTLEDLTEASQIVSLASGAMDDEMVMELAGTGDLLAESADGLATRETVELAGAVGENGEELSEAVDTIVELQESGTLDDLAGAAQMVSLASGAMDDEMVTTLAQAGNNLGEVADAAADPAASRGLEMLLQSISESCVHEEPPERMGVVGLMKAIRDPDVQRGLGFWMSVARNAGMMINERTCPPDEQQP